jgi:hypothetical protein
MDALYVEALFIENYLIPNNFELTDFEQEMVKSLKNDNLAGYSFVIEGVDMELVYYMHRLKTDKLTLSEKLTKYTDFGRKLLDDFKYPESGDYEKYCILVPLYSYTRYIYQIVYDCVYIENKIKPEEFKIEDYSKDIKKICDDMLIILNKYFYDYQSFRSKVISQIDNIYEKVFSKSDLNYEFLIFNKPLIFTHLITTDIVADKIRKNEIITKNMLIGNVEKLPNKLSQRNDENINAALKLYDKKKYKQAADILAKSYNDESENTFILNFYAKALYWFDREKSFEIYKKLIDILDKEDYKNSKYVEYKLNNEIDEIGNSGIKNDLLDVCKDIHNIVGNKIYVNLWFIEAYWKIGTLYLDKEDYLRGAYEITRFLLCGVGKDDAIINEQAMGYLTEAYTFLKKYDLARYCADKTLKINPKNKYVLYFIDKIKKEYHKE